MRDVGQKANMMNQAKSLCLTLAAVSALILGAGHSAPAWAEESESDSPSFISLNTGKGMAVRLPRAAKNVFVADPKVANVNPVSTRLVYVYGAGDGETTLYAVDNADKVIYSATVRVGNNISQLGQMLKLALPNSNVDVKTLNGMVFLSGFVGNPKDVEEAGRLTQQLVGEKQVVVNRLITQTPVQVMLQVKIAEVSRDTLKQIGVNWNATDPSSGFKLGLLGSRDFIQEAEFTQIFDKVTGLPTGQVFQSKAAKFLLSSFGGYSVPFSGGKILGANIEGAIDALDREGLLSVLAEPSLTALSGEKASFLAGGEFPVPIPDDQGKVSISFKNYGVGLDFIPVVHSSNRISLKLKTEVSQLTETGGVKLNSITIPALQTRKAETVVEMGSGESFAIAGLLQNTMNSDVAKMPGIGNLPIIGALFKSDRFRRQETELVIVVTPYLVKPMQSDQVRLPTDGLRAPDDLSRYLLARTFEQGLYKQEPLNGRGKLSANIGGSELGASGSVKPGFNFGQ
jgi:pilus assembly protein CpaC